MSVSAPGRDDRHRRRHQDNTMSHSSAGHSRTTLVPRAPRGLTQQQREEIMRRTGELKQRLREKEEQEAAEALADENRSAHPGPALSEMDAEELERKTLELRERLFNSSLFKRPPLPPETPEVRQRSSHRIGYGYSGVHAELRANSAGMREDIEPERPAVVLRPARSKSQRASATVSLTPAALVTSSSSSSRATLKKGPLTLSQLTAMAREGKVGTESARGRPVEGIDDTDSSEEESPQLVVEPAEVPEGVPEEDISQCDWSEAEEDEEEVLVEDVDDEDGDMSEASESASEHVESAAGTVESTASASRDPSVQTGKRPRTAAAVEPVLAADAWLELSSLGQSDEGNVNKEPGGVGLHSDARLASLRDAAINDMAFSMPASSPVPAESSGLPQAAPVATVATGARPPSVATMPHAQQVASASGSPFGNAGFHTAARSVVVKSPFGAAVRPASAPPFLRPGGVGQVPQAGVASVGGPAARTAAAPRSASVGPPAKRMKASEAQSSKTGLMKGWGSLLVRTRQHPQYNAEYIKRFQTEGRTWRRPKPDTKGRLVLGLDCEMVNAKGDPNALARVSVVGIGGGLLDLFVTRAPTDVLDYRTPISGVEPKHLLTENGAVPFEEAQERVLALIAPETILVGHALQNDLRALRICHTAIVDTALIFTVEGKSQWRKHKLKSLVSIMKKKVPTLHGVSVDAAHDSRQDADWALQLGLYEASIFPRKTGPLPLETFPTKVFLSEIPTGASVDELRAIFKINAITEISYQLQENPHEWQGTATVEYESQAQRDAVLQALPRYSAVQVGPLRDWAGRRDIKRMEMELEKHFSRFGRVRGCRVFRPAAKDRDRQLPTFPVAQLDCHPTTARALLVTYNAHVCDAHPTHFKLALAKDDPAGKKRFVVPLGNGSFVAKVQ